MGCCSSTSRDPPPPSPSSVAVSTTSSHPSLPATRHPDRTSARYTLRHGPPPPNADTLAAAAHASAAANRPLTRPTAWKSTSRTWTRAGLREEREAFFHTRVTGRPETWAAVRLAVEAARETGDLATAGTILEAAGLSCPTGKMAEGVWDERGVLYKLPKFVCSDPVNVEDGEGDGRKEAVLDDAVVEDEEGDEDEGGEQIKVRARLSDRAQDVVLHIAREAKVRVLVKKICEKAMIQDTRQVKLAYLGKLLKLDESLSTQGWNENHVVNALVISSPS